MKCTVVFYLVRVAKSASPSSLTPATDMFKDALNNRRDDHMDRWTGMIVRMCAPATWRWCWGYCLGIIRESLLLSGIYAVMRLAPAAAIVASVILGLIAIVRMLYGTRVAKLAIDQSHWQQ